MGALVSPSPRSLVCGFCGQSFVEDARQPACTACPLTGGCRWVRCPHCGYENPETPRWMRRLTEWVVSHGSSER